MGTAGVALLGVRDLENRREALLEARGAALQLLGRFAETSLRAGEARRSAELRQLRAELRREALWRQGLGRGPEETEARADRVADGERPDPPDAQDPKDVARRQLRSALRRALQASDEIRAFRILMADEQGISEHRFGRETVTAAGRARRAPTRSDRIEELWYEEDVRRAVAAAGRQVESSPWTGQGSGEGRGSQAAARRTIALHDSDDLIQGVLVAELDPSVWIAELSSRAGSAGTLELRSLQGRSLVDAVDEVDELDRRALEWAAQPRPSGAAAGLFESHGRLIAGGRLEASGATGSGLIWIARTAAPASLWTSAGRSPWSLAVLALILATGLTGWSLGVGPEPGGGEASDSAAPEASDPPCGARENPGTGRLADESPGSSEAIDEGGAVDGVEPVGRRIEPLDPNAKREAVDEVDEVDEVDASMSPGAEPEPFVLRDWLSDVRSCLEREAARRGLALEMRCARGLPAEIESDPVALGALLLALGRDALDETAGTGISIDIVGSPEADLRFELDVGDGSLLPPPGLGRFARTLGAEIELDSDHRIALVLAGPPQ